MPLSPRTLRPASSGFNPRQISGLALWLDGADSSSLYTTDAGPVSAVSSPTEISGCALWLDGADATSMFDATSGGSQVAAGGAIARWQDKSGNLRHATQSTTARQPTRQVGQQNGRDIVRFAGGQVVASSIADAAAQNVFVVAKSTASGSGRVFSYSGVSGNRSLYASTNWRWWSGNFDSGISSTSFGVASVAITSGTSVSMFGNGLAGAAGTTTSSASGTLSVGAEDTALANPFSGDVAEIVVYNTALSTSDRARVEAYLAAKWGISGVHAQATATSDPVGYWGDKSGNARHAVQATGANRPTVSTTTLNGRRTLGFDGSDDRLDIAALDTTPATVFSVVRHNSGTTTAARTPYAFSDGASYLHAQFIQSGASQMIGLTHNSSRSSFTADKIDVLGASFLLTSSQSSGGGGLVGRVNGSGLPFTVAVQDAGGANRVGCRFRNSANDQFWNGQIAELLVYQSALTDAQIARVERYLASRWGVTLAPQVSNADAQDWINRVYANGGTVSASTAAAVNTFCNAIDFGVSGVSIRDRFYRLNLFCGTGLNACLVPLYRGPSLGGTQFGNTTDSNVGSLFVSGDYSELGPNGGLAGGGSRYLNTGLASNVLSAGDRHLSAYEAVRSGGMFQTFLGTDEAGSQRFTLEYGGSGSTIQFGYGAFSANITVTSVSTGAHWIGVNSPATAGQLYRNGTLEASNTQTAQTLSSRNLYVYALNRSDSPTSHYAGRLGAYSIGSAMTASQAAAYYNAMQAFQTALSRNV